MDTIRKRIGEIEIQRSSGLWNDVAIALFACVGLWAVLTNRISAADVCMGAVFALSLLRLAFRR